MKTNWAVLFLRNVYTQQKMVVSYDCRGNQKWIYSELIVLSAWRWRILICVLAITDDFLVPWCAAAVLRAKFEEIVLSA